MTFLEQLLEAARRHRSWLCIGLDPDPRQIPAILRHERDPIYAFCAAIVEATADLVCAFKPNIAFFEALGAAGIDTLQRLIAMVPPEIPVILDAKRGDIGSTAAAYAHAAFTILGAHAVTLNPYLGGDSLAPFLAHADRGCLILCKTSNPGSADVQDLPLASGTPLYLEVARRARDEWNVHGNVGLVVGATHPGALQTVRHLCPSLPLLVPGVGAQGGELAAAARAATDRYGERAIMAISRSILYATDPDGFGSSTGNFAIAARQRAEGFRAVIDAALPGVML